MYTTTLFVDSRKIEGKKSRNQKGAKKERVSFVGYGSFCGNVFSAIGRVWMKYIVGESM